MGSRTFASRVIERDHWRVRVQASWVWVFSRRLPIGRHVERRSGHLRDAWWIAVFPGVAITLVVLASNTIGEGFRDLLDPQVYH